MNVTDAIKQRRSARAYLDKPIAPALLKKIFSQAQDSPSNCNTQPWHVVVVSGDVRDAIEKGMINDIMTGKPPTPHFVPGDQNLKSEHRTRQVACAVSLYGAMGIGREDKKERQELMGRNWQFFGAPHAAFFSMPKSMSEINAVDLGVYLQSLMLLLTENGLASCAQGSLAMYPDAVYELTNIPDGNAIMFGLSFGYADTDDVINQFDVGREELSTSVDFLG